MPRFYGETAGADIGDSKPGKCKKCQAQLLVGMVRRTDTGRLVWRNFDTPPSERDGLRYYTKHRCQT